MKKIYLVRHAKSSWKYPKLDDFERPLNKRGRKNAPFMGTVLKKRGILPDLILSSPANRAAMTARIMATRIDYPIEDVIYMESMYGADEQEMVEIVGQMDDGIDRLMLVGHNPGLTNLANTLGNDPVSNVPTSGIYAVRFKIASWNRIRNRRGKTDFFEYPKKYA